MKLDFFVRKKILFLYINTIKYLTIEQVFYRVFRKFWTNKVSTTFEFQIRSQVKIQKTLLDVNFRCPKMGALVFLVSRRCFPRLDGTRLDTKSFGITISIILIF